MNKMLCVKNYHFVALFLARIQMIKMIKADLNRAAQGDIKKCAVCVVSIKIE